MSRNRFCLLLLLSALSLCSTQLASAAEPSRLTLDYHDRILSISGNNLSGETLEVWYIEAYCRDGSTQRDWNETVIPIVKHQAKFHANKASLTIEDTLEDGVVVRHNIAAETDCVSFEITAHNPTDVASQLHWAQPCVRVDKFAGADPADRLELVPPYAKQCFVWIDNQPVRLPTEPWAKEAIYTPGQVYRPKSIPLGDVNPRPVSSLIPSRSLMACESADRKQIVGVVFEPCQELFQGVITCIHSDMRFGGLQPQETKTVRGKIYLLAADENNTALQQLEARYQSDFATTSADR